MDHVYRVENEKGEGPYVAREESVELNHRLPFLNEHDSSNGHPGPLNDPGIQRYMEADEYCGFETLKALREWFPWGELRQLKEAGFKVKKVPGRITARGRHQVLFVRPNSENF